MGLAHPGLGHRAFAVCRADPRERSMRGAHVATRLVTWKRCLLALRANGAGEELHFFDGAFQAELAEAKPNELEHEDEIQSGRCRLDVLLVKWRAFEMKGEIE